MEDRLMCFTPWDVQSKRQYSIDGVYPALNAGQGIGGQAHGVCYSIQGNLVDRNVGMNGIGVSDDGVSYTLNEVDRHAVCYGIDSHPMDSRIRLQEPDEPVQTLSRKMYKGTADVPMVLIDKSYRGGCVVIEGNGARPSHQGPGFLESDIMYTLNTLEHHAVAYKSPPDRVFQNAGHG